MVRHARPAVRIGPRDSSVFRKKRSATMFSFDSTATSFDGKTNRGRIHRGIFARAGATLVAVAMTSTSALSAIAADPGQDRSITSAASALQVILAEITEPEGGATTIGS